jgi:gas vesicle protein
LAFEETGAIFSKNNRKDPPMKTFTAILTGLAAGAAIGTLMAPDKGSKTRDKIAASARDFGDMLIQKRDEGIEALQDLKEQVVEMTKGGNGHRKSTSTRRQSTRSSRKSTVGSTAAAAKTA